MNTLSRAVGKLRFQAGASILAASMVGIGLGASRAEMDELYEPGQAIGEGAARDVYALHTVHVCYIHACTRMPTC
jgi:hypothetical protein